MKLSAAGVLMPVRGFSRRTDRQLVPGHMRFVSHDGLVVISSREEAELPGSGNPPLVGPQWLISVSRQVARPHTSQRCNTTDDDIRRVVESFDMPAFDEDNHHPGVARHLWCPVDEQYRQACECKVTEVTIVDSSGYRWTTEEDECRGCEYAQLTGQPCPLHPESEARTPCPADGGR